MNYIAFNPNIYLIDGQIASVFAMGDAVGNISIWALMKNGGSNKPIKLLKAPEIEMSVESIEWSAEGDILLASVRQGFIIVCSFGKDGFGKKLNR